VFTTLFKLYFDTQLENKNSTLVNTDYIVFSRRTKPKVAL